MDRDGQWCLLDAVVSRGGILCRECAETSTDMVQDGIPYIPYHDRHSVKCSKCWIELKPAEDLADKG